jgi:hypothetical protein
MRFYHLRWKCHRPDLNAPHEWYLNHGLNLTGVRHMYPNRTDGLWEASVQAYSAADAVTLWEVAASAEQADRQHVTLLGVQAAL